MGNWVYTPARAEGAGATLHDDGRSVDLRYTAQILQDLLTELGAIEVRFRTASAAAPEEHDTTSHRQPSHA
ncbi:hypothetical protein ACIQOU_28840 [Streptomyces sp. NPDC091279]|uniref:hypothetical protein n=1 Tax=unclassified Streptomyces TaxID=2593676 RepID=UPI0038183007